MTLWLKNVLVFPDHYFYADCASVTLATQRIQNMILTCGKEETFTFDPSSLYHVQKILTKSHTDLVKKLKQIMMRFFWVLHVAIHTQNIPQNIILILR